MMLSARQFHTPGTYTLTLPGLIGALEAELTVPSNANLDYVAILGHPHSLQGGTMHNKVVTTLVRTFRELQIPSLRFNFRGVGQSEGEYDAGIGESEDMLLLTEQCALALPGVKVIFAGFSFGSYVAYRAASKHQHCLLITIAPSVDHYHYSEFMPAPKPWIIVQGDEDEVVPAQHVFAFAANASPPLPLLSFSDTGHFFHGKLIELKSELLLIIRAEVPGIL